MGWKEVGTIRLSCTEHKVVSFANNSIHFLTFVQDVLDNTTANYVVYSQISLLRASIGSSCSIQEYLIRFRHDDATINFTEQVRNWKVTQVSRNNLLEVSNLRRNTEFDPATMSFHEWIWNWHSIFRPNSKLAFKVHEMETSVQNTYFSR